ncbi:WYL domain-containing protein [Thalassotalea sp. SU-HH00458]|uniref:helix-turn-helix transcriptional regulator n=1 Tax=Thalassotalea sp. SU-HH00458 TaxID=3127657 RepID=UPI003102EEAB
MEIDKNINKLSSAQRQRLAYIDFCLEYFGRISRIELSEHFDVGVTSCSRDFATYRKLAENNLDFRHSGKHYIRTNSFQPLFQHNAESALKNLANGFGDGMASQFPANPHCSDAVHLTHPRPQIVASLMRAIVGNLNVEIVYQSLSSGMSERVVAPHVIVNTGHRWHVRGFDYKSGEFRDFVCSRIENFKQHKTKPSLTELPESDISWCESIDLILIPHPELTFKRPIELDYDMIDGVKVVSIRKALAGYFLKYWNVDCSEAYRLPASSYHLCLKNREILVGLSTNMLAPGYKKNSKENANEL